MVEAYNIGKKKLRQNKEEVKPDKRAKIEQAQKSQEQKKGKKVVADEGGLTNVNVEEYKVDPSKFEDELNLLKPVGAQVFIQF